MSVQETVFNKPYTLPLIYDIMIKDSETFETKERYSMWDYDQSPFGMIDLSFNNPYGQLPSGYVEFHDPKSEFNTEVRKGDLIVIQGTKNRGVRVGETIDSPDSWTDSLPYYNMFYGKIERSRDIENKLGNNFIGLEAVGTAQIIKDSVIQFVKTPQYRNLKKGFANIEVNNVGYQVFELLKELFTSKEVLPSNFGYTLQERGGFSLDEIDKKIKEVFPSIHKSYNYASDLINELADYTGCIWGVDEYNKVYFRRINDKTLGHVLKSYKETSDNTNLTGFILDPKIEKISSNARSDGYFDVNYGFVQQSNLYDVGGDIINYTSSYQYDICQKVKAGISRFRNLTLTIQRVGPGTDSNDPNNTFITGHICNNVNNAPGPEIVARFWHPILQVPTTPTNVSFSIMTEPLDIDINADYWIVLHKRGTKDTNCYRWYNNGVFDAVNVNDQWSGIRRVFERQTIEEAYMPAGYEITNHGPTYSYAFASYTNIPNVAYNPLANSGIKRAPVEVVYNINYIKDFYTMQKFLNLTSFAGNMEPITFQFNKVTIPNIPIRSGYAGQLITRKIAPKESGGIIGTITNVGYKVTGRNEDDPAGPVGNSVCNVDFVGYFDPLDYKTDPQDLDDDY